MPEGTGGLGPEEIGRRRSHLNGGSVKSSANEPSPLERLIAARQAEKAAQRRRDSRVLAALITVAVLIAGGGAYAWLRFNPPLRHHPAAAHRAPTPTVSPALQLHPVTVTGPPAYPFAGSPAAAWPEGAAGITIPAAHARAPFTAAQVRSAYEMTRRLLIAGNLDWPTLRGKTPTAFANLLTRQQRAQFLAGLHKTTLAKDGTADNTRSWVTSFVPGTQFVTTVVKVHGSMSARTVTESGSPVLRVTVDYLFVYAVEPAGDPADWMRIVVQWYGDVDFATWDDPGGHLEPWWSVAGQNAGDLCGTRDGYIHPDYPHGPPPSVQPSGTPQDPYSLATPPAAGGVGCHATTGT